MPGPGSLGGGFVPAASYRMRRSPARPPAPRKARTARNTPLRPGRVLIAAALAGLAAGAGIAATAGEPAIRLAPADNPAATSQYTPTIGPAATPSPAASSAPPAPDPSPSAGAAEPPAISTAAARRVLASYWAANNQANKARSDTLLARIEAGTSYQMDAGAYRTGRAAGPALRVHARHCGEPRLVDPAPASRDLPALVRRAGHLHRRRRRLTWSSPSHRPAR